MGRTLLVRRCRFGRATAPDAPSRPRNVTIPGLLEPSLPRSRTSAAALLRNDLAAPTMASSKPSPAATATPRPAAIGCKVFLPRTRHPREDAARWTAAGRATALSAGVLLAALAAPQAALAVQPLQQLDVVLLQPGPLIEQRVDGGADAMADYLQRLGAAETEAMRQNPQQIPTSGFIVVAVRPGGLAHAWFDFTPALSAPTAAALAHVVETLPPTPVKRGNLVFALRVSLWGARAPEKYAPVPPEWREAGRQAGHKLDLDALVDQVWPR
jgi:hypothetical protein